MPLAACGDPGNHERNSTLYFKALEKAYKFHLIIQTELLADENYARGIEQYFGVSGFVGSRFNAWCDKESKAANARYPVNVSLEERQSLRRKNEVDYDLLSQLTYCPDRIQFPDGNLSQRLPSAGRQW